MVQMGLSMSHQTRTYEAKQSHEYEGSCQIGYCYFHTHLEAICNYCMPTAQGGFVGRAACLPTTLCDANLLDCRR